MKSMCSLCALSRSEIMFTFISIHIQVTSMYITALCSTYSFASSHDNDALDAYTCSTMCSTIVMFTPRSTTRSRDRCEIGDGTDSE